MRAMKEGAPWEENVTQTGGMKDVPGVCKDWEDISTEEEKGEKRENGVIAALQIMQTVLSKRSIGYKLEKWSGNLS